MIQRTPAEVRALDLALSELSTAVHRELLVRLTGERALKRDGDGPAVKMLRAMVPPLVIGWTPTPWGRIVADRLKELRAQRKPRKGHLERRQTATEAAIVAHMGDAGGAT